MAENKENGAYKEEDVNVVIAEMPNFLQVFSNGTIKRYSHEIALPSEESSNPYKSKDIIIDPSKPITGRMFLPNIPNATATNCPKLPILVYFHGGGFCLGSTTWLNYHILLGELSSLGNVIVLSIDYRLVPENRLPIPYEDCYSSLEWLVQNPNNDPWVSQGDLSKVFLSGDSAGANIAHNVAIRAIKDGLQGISIKGLLMMHPFFGSEKRTDLEMVDEGRFEIKMNDIFWKLSVPEGMNRDYFGCNFESDEVDVDEWSQFPEVMVFVAGLDFLRERGVMYAEFLGRKIGKDVKVVEAKDEIHVFYLFYPHSEATRLLRRQMTDFINGV